MTKKRDEGFSLLELLIVVAIILIIATIAIPSLVQSRQTANEASAVQTIKAVHAAQILHSTTNGGRFGTFGELTAGGYLDERFAGGDGTPTLGGYTYTLTVSGTNNSDYVIQADPSSSTSGRFDFYSTPDGLVRYRTDLGGRTPGAPVQ